MKTATPRRARNTGRRSERRFPDQKFFGELILSAFRVVASNRPSLIELERPDGVVVHVNPARVEHVCANGGGNVRVHFNADEFLEVKGGLDEVVRKLMDCPAEESKP